MSTDKTMKSEVTACIDGSEMTESVIDAAAWASRQLAAPLRFLHVLEKVTAPISDRSGTIAPSTATQLLDELTELDEKRGRVAMELGRHMLDSARSKALAAGATSVSTQQRHGGLLEALDTFEPSTRLFVIGRLGEDHDIDSRKLGAHLESLVRSVRTPTIVAVGGFSVPATFMIAYDGSATANKAIAEIADSDMLKSMHGHVVMVAADNDANRRQLDSATELLASHGHDVQSHLRQGNVVAELTAFRQALDIGLIVMGAYGHSRVREFFVGSNTSKMLSSSPVPVLLLR